jgi:hypothetical protein
MLLSRAAAATALLLCGVAQAQTDRPANAEPAIGVGVMRNTPDQAKQLVILQSKGNGRRTS